MSITMGEKKNNVTKFKKGENNGNTFTKDNQPSKLNRSFGQKKRRTIESLAKAVISGDALTQAKLINEKRY